MIFFKLSLGLFFLRVLQTPWQRCIVYTVVTFSTLVNLTLSFWSVFQCGDPAHFIAKLSKGQCTTQRVWKPLGLVQAAGNVVTDFILAAMPLPMLWSSQMVLPQKMMVGAILMLATL
jgi:hypothetical protein